MKESHYSDLLDRLYALGNTGAIKLGLENSFRLSEHLNNPASSYKTIHVAGTNGKGSVTTKIAKGLEAEGYQVGLYTSPHIETFRERIQVNGVMITEDEVVEALVSLFAICDEQNIKATFFELTTLMAFDHFRKKGVNYAVIETGLGGRLDATNIITPVLSIITSISKDHTELLGHTLEEIAREKAGIIKPNVPALIGPRVPLETSNLIRQLPKSFTENEDLARAALQFLNVSDKAIEKGLKASPPCRFQHFNLKNNTVILDVAHNPDGFQYLFKKLEGKKVGVLLGLGKMKDHKACVEIVKAHAEHIYPISGEKNHAVPAERIHELVAEGSTLFATTEEAMDVALKNHETVVVCGTFYVMSSVLKEIARRSS